MITEEKQQIANEVCKWLKSNIYNYASIDWTEDNRDEAYIDRHELFEDLEKEILKKYKENKEIGRSIYNFLRFDLDYYTGVDGDYEVCIAMDELLKDLEKEILK